MTKQTRIVVIGALRVNILLQAYQFSIDTHWILHNPQSALQRLWLDCPDANKFKFVVKHGICNFINHVNPPYHTSREMKNTSEDPKKCNNRVA